MNSPCRQCFQGALEKVKIGRNFSKIKSVWDIMPFISLQFKRQDNPNPIIVSIIISHFPIMFSRGTLNPNSINLKKFSNHFRTKESCFSLIFCSTIQVLIQNGLSKIQIAYSPFTILPNLIRLMFWTKLSVSGVMNSK